MSSCRSMRSTRDYEFVTFSRKDLKRRMDYIRWKNTRVDKRMKGGVIWAIRSPVMGGGLKAEAFSKSPGGQTTRRSSESLELMQLPTRRCWQLLAMQRGRLAFTGRSMIRIGPLTWLAFALSRSGSMAGIVVWRIE